MTAFGLLQEELNVQSIPTSSRYLDKAMQNGIRTGIITEIVGGSGTGKTQLCLQLVINTIVPQPLGVIDGDAIYISTKRNFCPQRVIELVDNFVEICGKVTGSSSKNKFTREKALERIHVKRVGEPVELVSAVHHIKKFMQQQRNVRIIVIDSFSALLRNYEHLEKIRVIYEILHILQTIAVDHKCAVILTNDLTPDFASDVSDSAAPMKPLLGYSHFHRIQQRLMLTKGKGNNIVVGIRKNWSGGPSEVELKITSNGITDGASAKQKTEK